MKRRQFLAAPLAAGLAGQTAKAQIAAGRPRLFFDATHIRQIKGRMQRDAAFRKITDAWLERANQLLTVTYMTEEAANKGSGDDASFGGASQQMGNAGMMLGLAWQISDDQRYAQKLREAMLHFAAYSVWHGPGFPKRVVPWHSELNTARFCFGVAVGYDALYTFLPAAERATIREALIRMGILATFEDWLAPATRIHALDSMGHNWWSVCVSNAGLAALAVYGEEPRAAGWVNSVDEAMSQWFAYRGEVLQNKSLNFDPAGAFYESVNYANYAIFEYLRYRLSHGNVFPGRKQAENAPLSKVIEFFLHSTYPTSTGTLNVNFGDSPPRVQCAPAIRLMVETGFGHPAAGWYLSKASSTAPDMMEILARKPVPPVAKPTLPASVIYPDIGWAILRSSWDDDATFLAVKSGFTWNHAHADAGSFTLFHGGKPLIIDSGTCSYGRPEYAGVYVQSPAHNVVLFNGEGEPPGDHLHASKFPGHLHDLVDHLGVRYVYADATGPMAHALSRNYRHFLWIDGAILIFDDLLSRQPGDFDWLLHYEGSANRNGNIVSLTNGNAAATVQMLYPEALDGREMSALADHDPNRKVPYLAFRPKEKSAVQKFITAVIPSGGAALPRVTYLSGGKNCLGVRVEGGTTVTDVFLNLQADGRMMHLNSNNVIDGWETDAYLLGWTRPAASPDAVERIFVANGSYLRRSQRSYLDSLSKVNAVWRPGDPQSGQVLGQPQKSVRLS